MLRGYMLHCSHFGKSEFGKPAISIRLVLNHFSIKLVVISISEESNSFIYLCFGGEWTSS